MKIIESLKQLSTPELSDALDSLGIEGALSRIKPLSAGMKLVGPVYTVRYKAYETKPETFKPAGDYIDNVPEGAVILIDNEGKEDCTVWGGILTAVAKEKNIAGTVVFGAIRDAAFIKQLDYPLFCCATFMRSGKNRVYKAEEQTLLDIMGVKINPGDFLFADDNGALVIPLNRLDEIIKRAQNINKTESKIFQAVQQGMTLKEARQQYHYHKPWRDLND